MPRWPKGGSSVIDTGYIVKIPKGTLVHVGEVSAQTGIFLGGTEQVFIEKPWTLNGAQIIEQYKLKEELLWNKIALTK